MPISAVAPAATAATPTPYFRNSLRETFLFELFSDSFCTLSSDVKLISGGSTMEQHLTVFPDLARFFPDSIRRQMWDYVKPVEDFLFPSDSKEVREG